MCGRAEAAAPPSSGASRHLLPDGEKNSGASVAGAGPLPIGETSTGRPARTSGGATTRARRLRREATDAENRLWYVLKNRAFLDLKFARQVPVGRYIADFVCREIGLIIELDGSQHAESVRDELRTAHLVAEGYDVLRFWNSDVLTNRDGVLQAISDIIAGHPSPDLRYAQATLSPTGRGTRGARAARAAFAARSSASRLSSETPSVPLPVGERVDRPQAETGEGFQGTNREMP